MTSKTFKSVHPENREQSLSIRDDMGRVSVSVSHGSRGVRGIMLSQSDAPAFALAVLEAAYGSDHPVPHKISEAWTSLYVHIIEEERATAEAKEQAELEAEALELINAYRASFLHCAPEDGFEGFDDPEAIKAKWLAVARRAREMRAEK